MPQKPKPDSSYDDELWKSIRFVVDIWNRVVPSDKIEPFAFYGNLREVISRYFDDIESPDDLLLTIFVEFFYCNHEAEDGHVYRYYYKNDIVTVNTYVSYKEKRNVYWPLPLDSWFCSNDKVVMRFPFATRIYDSSHYTTRSLLRILAENKVIKREWLTDYDEHKEDYEIDVYECIDNELDENGLIEVRDAYGVITRGEVEQLYKALKTICMKMYKAYEEESD